MPEATKLACEAFGVNIQRAHLRICNMADPAGDVLKQIDGESWLIDHKLLLSRSQTMLASDYLWRDEAGWYYTIMPAPTPVPKAMPLPKDS